MVSKFRLVSDNWGPQFSVQNLTNSAENLVNYAADHGNTVSGRHSQGPPFPASVIIFIGLMLMLLHTKEVLINKKLG